MRITDFLFRLHFNSSLKTKLIFAYSALILIPILFLGLTSYGLYRGDMIASEKRAITQNMEQLSNTLDYFFEIYMNKSDLVFTDETLQKELKTPKSNVRDLAFSYSEITELISSKLMDIRHPRMRNSYYFGGTLHWAVYTMNPTLRSDGTFIHPLDTIRNLPAIRQLYEEEGKRFAWRSGTIGADDTEYISMYRRLLDFETTEDLGVLELRIPVTRVKNIILQNNQNPHYSLLYSDRLHSIVKTGVFEHLDSNDSSIDSWFQREGRSSGIDEIIMNGKTYILGHTESNINGWRLYFLYPVSRITNKLDTITYITGVTILISISLCIVIAFMISSYISRRIQQLVTKTNRIGEGHIVVDEKIRGNDEIGQLDRNFNLMVQRLNHLIENEYKAKLTLKQTQLELLQDQINPHLYYNTLSMIGLIAKRRNQSDILQATQHLISFYRRMLNKGKLIVQMKRELDMVVHYAAVVRFVYGVDLELEMDVNPVIQEHYAIKLILQPIVENAVLHGIRPKGEGVLNISGEIVNGTTVRFMISDDGVGMTPDKLNEIQHSIRQNIAVAGKGYGLRNVTRRLQLFFGEPYGLEIESTPGAGTTIVMTYPLVTSTQIERIMERKYLVE